MSISNLISIYSAFTLCQSTTLCLANTQNPKKRAATKFHPLTFKDYRDHDFPNTEFSYFLTIDTRQ